MMLVAEIKKTAINTLLQAKQGYYHITFGDFSISTKHMRQFPATESRSW